LRELKEVSASFFEKKEAKKLSLFRPSPVADVRQGGTMTESFLVPPAGSLFFKKEALS
jgi:hypothetical protein